MSDVAAQAAEGAPKADEPAKQDPVAEQKAEGAKAPEAKAEASGGEKKEEAKAVPEAEQKVVPEKYDLKLSEDSLLDQGSMERIAAIARERGLSNEEAQGFLQEQEKATQTFIDERKAAWLAESKADKEIGGDALNENAELAKRVVERFGNPTLKSELDRTGYGNHPELIRLLTRIGKAMSEDKLVKPGAQAQGSKSLEDVFYGNPKHKE